MLQLEDNIDAHKVTIETYYNKFIMSNSYNYQNEIQDIKTFIYIILHSNNRTAFIKKSYLIFFSWCIILKIAAIF